MKIIYTILIFVFAATVVLAGDFVISSLTASSDGKNITVKWATTNETNIARFEIERAIKNNSGSSNFTFIGSVDAKGRSDTYNFIDESAYLKSDNSKVQANTNYYYRIKVIKRDNTYFYTDPTSVLHNVSGFQRTWGMIKEMFK